MNYLPANNFSLHDSYGAVVSSEEIRNKCCYSIRSSVKVSDSEISFTTLATVFDFYVIERIPNLNDNSVHQFLILSLQENKTAVAVIRDDEFGYPESFYLIQTTHVAGCKNSEFELSAATLFNTPHSSAEEHTQV